MGLKDEVEVPFNENRPNREVISRSTVSRTLERFNKSEIVKNVLDNQWLLQAITIQLILC